MIRLSVARFTRSLFEFESRFPLQTPRSNAGRFFVFWGLVCPARLVYKSRLYRKTTAERLSLVQVSRIKPIIRPIPEDLSIKPRPETHFGAQARLVHHFVGSARQIHLGALFLFGRLTYVSLHRSINHLIFISPDAGWRRTDDGRSFWGPNNA